MGLPFCCSIVLVPLNEAHHSTSKVAEKSGEANTLGEFIAYISVSKALIVVAVHGTHPSQSIDIVGNKFFHSFE